MKKEVSAILIFCLIITSLTFFSNPLILTEKSTPQPRTFDTDPETDWAASPDNDHIPSKVSRNSGRNNWYDSFLDESKIETKDNLIVVNGNVELNTKSFTITTTADFDSGLKDNIETRTDNPTLPQDEIRIVADNTIYTELFEGVDETDLTSYDSNWVISKNGVANAKIDTDEKNSGSSSLRFFAKGANNRINALRNTGEYGIISVYVMVPGPNYPSLLVYAMNGNTNVALFFLYNNNDFKYKNGATTITPGYKYSFGTWYKVKMLIDFDNQVYDVIIDGGSYNNFHIVNDANFMNPANSVDGIKFGNHDGWADSNSYTFYDNVNLDSYRTSATWRSAAQTQPLDYYVKDTTLTFSSLASGVSEIDRIEWVVNDIAKATYETNIVNDGLSPHTITESDLTSGSFKNIDADFRIKLYLTSDGSTTPVIKQIDGTQISRTGTLISTPISAQTNYVWDELTLDKTEPATTYLNISVLDGATNQPFQDLTDLVETSIDLAAIDVSAHPTIKLQADFWMSAFNPPVLHEWGVAWSSDHPELTMNIPSNWAFAEDTNADDLINLADYFDDEWTPDNKLKFQVIYESDYAHINAKVDGTYLDFNTPTINWSGYEIFKVKCTDEGGLSVNSNEFKVTVTEVNDPPEWTPIDFFHIDEDSELTKIVELDKYIFDVDDVVANISYSVASNNNPTNILVQIQNKVVYSKPLIENFYGDAIIKIRAYDGYASANTTILIIVDPLNDLPIVELLSPADTAIFTTSTIKLTWSEGFDVDSAIVSYDVYLDEVSPPQTLISNDQTVTSFTIQLEDGTYYWTVLPFDGNDEGIWDADKIWSFTIITEEDPPTPAPTITLASPYDETIINTDSIELFWNSNLSFTDLRYLVYFDTEAAPNKIVGFEITATSFVISDLTDGGTYYWTVIPVSGSLMGLCEDGIWSFTVQLDFIPIYNVELNGVKNLIMNQSESRFCNLTVTNEGNIKDIFTPELEAGTLSRDVKFHKLGNIILDPGESTLLSVLISLPEDAATGYHNISVSVSSFWGGKTINDTHQVLLKVEPKALPPSEPVTKDKSDSNLFLWLALIIIVVVILIAIAVVTKKRRQKMEAALKAEGITKPTVGGQVLLPDIVSKPGEVPRLGAAGTVTAPPALKPVVTTTMLQPTVPQIARVPATPQLPQVTQVTVTPVAPVPVPAPIPVQPRPFVSTPPQVPPKPEKELSKAEKLKLLDERLLKGEIDLATYKELRRKFEQEGAGAQIPPPQPRLPPTGGT